MVRTFIDIREFPGSVGFLNHEAKAQTYQLKPPLTKCHLGETTLDFARRENIVMVEVEKLFLVVVRTIRIEECLSTLLQDVGDSHLVSSGWERTSLSTHKGLFDSFESMLEGHIALNLKGIGRLAADDGFECTKLRLIGHSPILEKRFQLVICPAGFDAGADDPFTTLCRIPSQGT